MPVGSNFHVPSPITSLPFPQPIRVSSWGIPSEQFTEQNKGQVWLSGGSANEATPTHVDAPGLHSGVTTEDHTEGKSSKWTELGGLYLVVYFTA